MRSFIAIFVVLAISAVFANCTRRSPQTVPSSALGQSSVPNGPVSQIPVEESRPVVSVPISQEPLESPIPLDVPSDAPAPDDAGVDAPDLVPTPPLDPDVP